MKESKEKKLFNLIDSIGEILKGKIHIICTSDQSTLDKDYRVYHKFGYCFDIDKVYVCPPERVSDYAKGDVEEDGFSYEFFAEWSGFEDLDVGYAIRIIKKWKSGDASYK